jgi:hypothetical protein
MLDRLLGYFEWYRRLSGGKWYLFLDTRSNRLTWYRAGRIPRFNPLHKRLIRVEEHYET